jgi:hypothetical protein
MSNSSAPSAVVNADNADTLVVAIFYSYYSVVIQVIAGSMVDDSVTR